MHAFLIDSSKLTIDNSFDTLVIKPDISIGIEEVRQIQHFLSRKPTQSDHNTVVIYQAHLLTIPAQNALLKTLEEPPGNSQIYLVTDFPDQLLPTVLSRVQLASNPKSQIPNPKILEKTKKLLDKLLAAGVGERLKLIDEQAFTRETALEFINHLEYLIHNQIQNSQLSIVNYQLLTQTRKYLKANCNIKLTLDHFCLSLS